MTNIQQEIKDNKFLVYLQGKYNTQTEQLVGAEALIRKKEGNKIIYPNEFIPYYEKTGEIIELDMFVLEEVCKLQEMWKSKNIKVLPISVNKSKLFLKNPNYLNDLEKVIKKYDVNPNNIELELTETTVIDDINLVSQAAKNVHKLGFKTSMDDFGTGYSAFNLLKDIDIDILKIDKLFFENIENNQKAQIIVQAIVDMCKKLNIQTVAEGIETVEQVKFLKQIKCDLIQGYYFSRTVPIVEF